MRKSVLSQYQQGSAEQVVVHAAWRRSRGRRPSMSFVEVRNPRKALALATYVIKENWRIMMSDLRGASLFQQKSFRDMTDDEFEVVAGYIIRSSSSWVEMERRFHNEPFNYPYNLCHLCRGIPDVEERGLVQQGRSSRLVMRNGEVVYGMLQGNNALIAMKG